MLDHVVIGDSSSPIIAVLHGIFGAGNNWRSFVQHWRRARPDLCFVLIDLRNHGDSPHFDEDNTLAQCAQEVLDLQETVGDFRAIVGHSFGGKVALQCAAIPMVSDIEQVWALDSFPGALDSTDRDQNDVQSVLSWLRGVSMPVVKRSVVKEHLIEKGATTMMAQWMTTNLSRTLEGFVWRFHMDGIEELLQDYFQTDLWYTLEYPNPQMTTHLVRALQSDRWDAESIERLEDLGADQYHTLDAGHWVHVDNPTGLLALLKDTVLPIE
mgnify:FL=1